MAAIKRACTVQLTTAKSNIDEINEMIETKIFPMLQDQLNKVQNIENNVDNTFMPLSVLFVTEYEPIIIRMLLSNIFMGLNRIFKWYTYSIHIIKDDKYGEGPIIKISPCYDRFTFDIRHKEFKKELKRLNKRYGATYASLVNATIYYNITNIRRNK